ncbi:ubiquinone anaerobic biosynthesis protein UbiV [Benzoatithermus flavus]|uniref:Ubiquinone biosynthesis protein UbiV n=1 Tax=Benzoatithermus flavus TaxID=3108223 RepID=A0ABU8XL98_9PROT
MPDAPAVLTLGPVLFHWPAAALRDFYFRIADEAPVETVHLGEVVCSKRLPFFAPHLPEVIERLQAAGKEVVLSSLALVMDKREAASMAELCGDAEPFLVEANDMAAVGLLAGRPHAVGPFVNVYNEATLAWLKSNGAVRVCLPVELPESSIRTLAAVENVALELMVWGRLPLALSARCYHARAHGRRKDDCRFACGEDPDGMDVTTLDGEPFLTVNGIQTMSHSCVSLAHRLEELRAVGVRRFRLSPQSCDMVAVAHVFRALLDRALDAEEAEARLAALFPTAPLSNGFLFGREGVLHVRPG